MAALPEENKVKLMKISSLLNRIYRMMEVRMSADSDCEVSGHRQAIELALQII
jgi:hypothetical protein